MPRLLQIAQLGNHFLREKAKLVPVVTTPNIQELIDDMIATVMDVDGVGLAAPQIYELHQIFIMASHPNPRYPFAPRMKPAAMINPKITSHSWEKEKDWEGCLSIPGVRAIVSRFTTIEVEYFDRSGKKIETHFDHFLARIFGLSKVLRWFLPLFRCQKVGYQNTAFC